MSPFPGKSAVTEVEAIVRRVDDDRVFSEALCLELGDEAPHDVVDSTQHPEVGPHVGLVFLRGVPAPEEALPVERLLEEGRL